MLQSLDSRARVFTRHRNVSGGPQVSAQEGNLEQLRLRQEQKVFWDIAEDHRNVHEADVVRDEHVVPARLYPVESFDGHFHADDTEQGARPRTRDCELAGRGAVEQRDQEAADAEESRGKNDERDDVDPAPYL